ncbi:MAG TPA: DUF6259 domain-containing protein, partial [Chloroflexota bacterium]|nr:DUF6259 domain-containing protein [Chloroflexota bacterium]
ILRDWLTCTVEADSQTGARILWSLDQGLRLEAGLELDPAGDLQWTVALRNPQGLPVAALAYPYLVGLGALGQIPEDDQLIHPYATGFLVRDPLHALPLIVSETEGEQPVVLGLYPEGFSGSTMQFMAYSALRMGGFYLAAEDGEGREKWLNAYLHPDGDLRMAVWHSPGDYAGRRDVLPAYRVVLAALDGGDWYAAADRYKAWALTQPWAARGPLWARDDLPRWLFERVGLCTFGINPRYDRVPWLAEIDRIAGTPVMHLLGPNWPRTEANYRNNLPGGLADWFPARFHPANLEHIRSHGDYLVPFEFDLLFGQGEEKADAAEGARALQEIPTPTLSRDAYHFPFLCPASSFTRTLHAARDRELVQGYKVDGVYYDISVNNVRHTCLSEQHGHAPGDAAAISTAATAMLAETAAAMRAAAGGWTIPQGTEMINERMLPSLWFYQARAEASPAAPFEAGPFLDLIEQGKAEKIPLFTYIYHEHGPVRMDGWAKLSREQGDYVYFVLGRIFLQGGLIELNYEFSGLEDLEEHRDVAAEHYFLFAERRFTIDPELARFVGRLARARIGPANRYLAYGAMRRPAPLIVAGEPTLTLAYFFYNASQEMRNHEARGTMVVPTVLHTAWRYRDESAAWLLLNLAPDPREVRIELEVPATLPRSRLTLHQDGEPLVDLGVLAERRVVTLTLPARCPVLLEAGSREPPAEHGASS